MPWRSQQETACAAYETLGKHPSRAQSACGAQRGRAALRGLADEALQPAIALGQRQKRLKGEKLFEQGAPAEVFHLMLAGRLKDQPDNARETACYPPLFRPDEIARCEAVCGGVPCPATAEAIEEIWLLSWTRPHIAELADRHLGIAMTAVRIMDRRMTELQGRLREMQTDRVERRIAHALGRLVLHAGRRTREGIEVDFPLMRQDLAEMTGTTLHTVSRTLSEWEAAGFVASPRQKVVILALHTLVSIAEALSEARV